MNKVKNELAKQLKIEYQFNTIEIKYKCMDKK